MVFNQLLLTNLVIDQEDCSYRQHYGRMSLSIVEKVLGVQQTIEANTHKFHLRKENRRYLNKERLLKTQEYKCLQNISVILVLLTKLFTNT